MREVGSDRMEILKGRNGRRLPLLGVALLLAAGGCSGHDQPGGSDGAAAAEHVQEMDGASTFVAPTQETPNAIPAAPLLVDPTFADPATVQRLPDL